MFHRTADPLRPWALLQTVHSDSFAETYNCKNKKSGQTIKLPRGEKVTGFRVSC